jgi:hypothetical protein
MSKFDDIRPYNDDEVRPVIERLLVDNELLTAIGRFRFPWAPEWLLFLIKPLIQHFLKRQSAAIHSVYDLQTMLESYMERMSDDSMSGLHVSGLENLTTDQPHVFISNHRDIAMDPALLSWVLHRNQHKTLRVAIGNNLLSKPYVSDLMRLNKCFIVNRSATAPREKLKAAKHLSAYIHSSITDDNASVWIAQKEGRAKDGLDRTNSAVIGMLGLSKPKKVPLADYINELNIVPVSISYEYDPCDEAKAKELYSHSEFGEYDKDEHEDASSIAKGIVGFKGNVHIHFGEVLTGDYQSTDEVVADIDEAIISNYHVHPSNMVAYCLLHGPCDGEALNIPDFHTAAMLEHKQRFEQRVANCDSRWRDVLISMYANPVVSQQTLSKQSTV